MELARMANVKIIVHENFRFQPWHLQIKKMLDNGMIGEPYQVSVRMRPGDGQGAGAYLSRQPYFQKMERFLIHETAIHFIDVFRYYFGEIASVYADLVKLNPNILGEDAGFVIFKFKNGVRGVFDGNRLSDHIAEDRRRTIGDLLVEGSKGSIRLNGDGDIFFRELKIIDFLLGKFASQSFSIFLIFCLCKLVCDPHKLHGIIGNPFNME